MEFCKKCPTYRYENKNKIFPLHFFQAKVND